MTPMRGLIQTMKGWIGKPVAGPETDPQRFFGLQYALPNPDPILREMGQAERVYFSIMTDPHVLGDVRSIRGNFRGHEYRVVEGLDGDSKSLAAQQLCEQWMRTNRPNGLADWLETMWQMSSAFMTGYRPHELVWALQSGNYLPGQVVDRPGRRFRFNASGEPLLISVNNMLGAPVEPYQFVISRHMADMTNPYGVATLSSCFWPWTFKTNGWRYLVRYCERHGLPWPIARYPIGTSEPEINKLGEAIGSMIEDAYAVVQEGTGVELLVPTTSGSGALPQEHLIDRANREMSKALTGQAMVSELHGVGARAASETALKRQESIDDSVRDIAADSFNFIFRWITLFNFGDGVAPPTLEFFQRTKAGKDRAEAYQIVANMGARPSRSAFLEEMGIPEAEDEADALQPVIKPTVTPDGKTGLPLKKEPATTDFSAITGFEFARAAGMTEDEAMQLAADAADQAIEDNMIEPVARMLAQFEADGKSLADFQAALEDMVGVMDADALREVIERAMTWSILKGAATRAA